ncbi:MAG: carboxypeptidase regulatory-like domain-containing protein [Bacteroidales bacterium]|nr:carboxypeptidase regulatory-like domain-containing protein [Bacteroidales bacterium]
MKNTRIVLGVFVASLLFLLGSCVKDAAPETGSIQGIVTNSANNEPIQGVNISLSPTGLSAVTGSDGRYEFVKLPSGQYTVQGVKSGFESNTKNITVIEGNISSGDMMLTPEVSGFRLNVEYLDFGTNFSQLSFKIINTSTSLPVSWSITESMAWLTATPSSGNLNAGQEVAVLVSIDRDQIEQSTTTNLTVTAGDQTVVLPVNVSVSGSNSAQLQLSENSLEFGTSATSLTFYVLNTGPANTSLNWTCSNVTVDWLTITPTSGNIAGGSSTPVIASIDRTMIDGIVSTSVNFSGAGSTQSITINAASEGSGMAILQLSEGSLDFGEEATTKTFQVKNVGATGTMLEWYISTPTEEWLSFSPMTGSTNAGSGTLVTATIDRSKIHSDVSTTVAVIGQTNEASISISATCPSSNVLVTDGLIAYYNFDDGAVTDWGGNYDGLNFGALTSTDTPSGEGFSMQFDGQTSYLYVPYVIMLHGVPWSYNVWFKTGSNNCILFATNASSFYIGFTNASKLTVRTQNYWTTNNPFTSYLNNQWHMLTVTYSGSSISAYIDGVLFDTTTVGNYYWNSSYNSSTSFGTGGFSGKMDNIRTYSRVLTADEIRALYNAKQ